MPNRGSTSRRVIAASTVTPQKMVEIAGLLALVALLLFGLATHEWWLSSPAPLPVPASAPLDRLTGAGPADDLTGTVPDASSTGPSRVVGPSGLPELCWRFQTGGLISEAPAVVDGTVYVGSWDGSVYALDATTGALRWRFPTEHRIDAAPVLAGGVVFVGSTAGFVVALDAASGAELWRFATASKPAIAPLFLDGTLFVVSGFGGAQPAAANGTVYAGGGGDDRYLQAVDARTGAERWRAALDRNGVNAIDAESGREHWFLDTGHRVDSSPVVDGDTVYAEDGLLYRIDAERGVLRWQSRLGNTRWRALVAAGTLLLATGDDAPTIVDGMGRASGWLLAVDAATGEERWRVPTGGPARAAPVLAAGVAYVAADDGTVYAVDAATGQERWRLSLGEGSLATTVAGGRLYAGGADGTLVVLGDGCRNRASEQPHWAITPA